MDQLLLWIIAATVLESWAVGETAAFHEDIAGRIVTAFRSSRSACQGKKILRGDCFLVEDFNKKSLHNGICFNGYTYMLFLCLLLSNSKYSSK